MIYFLIQCPSSQEDEGRWHLMSVHKTKKKAKTARDMIVKASNGYFRKSSFKIASARSNAK